MKQEGIEITWNGIDIIDGYVVDTVVDELSTKDKLSRSLNITTTVEFKLDQKAADVLYDFVKNSYLQDYHTSTGASLDAWVSAISGMKVIRNYEESDKELRDRLSDWCSVFIDK